MDKSDSITELAQALSKFQGSLDGVKRESTNPFFKSKYASLSTIWEHIKKPLQENGLSVVQQAQPDIQDGHIILDSILLHTSGEWISGSLPLRPVKDDPQGMGSAITYARRYALSALLGIVADEDDDAETAQDRKPKAVISQSEPKSSKPVDDTPIKVDMKELEVSLAKLRSAKKETGIEGLPSWEGSNLLGYLNVLSGKLATKISDAVGNLSREQSLKFLADVNTALGKLG